MTNSNKIKVGICGYGNLGKGVELAIKETPDMEVKVIFTRRNASELEKQTDIPIVSIEEAKQWVSKLDVVILCGGSKKDLPVQVPEFAEMFNTVNTFDTHDDILAMYENVDTIAKKAGKISVISTGWDPGLFSMIRKMGSAIFMKLDYYTFWGPGVSQGHSDAIRKIEGVINAIQYTKPFEDVLKKVREGAITEKLKSTQMHYRECFVVAEPKDYERITEEIKTMPKYFEGYQTIVHFVSEAEILERQKQMFHGGTVICVATTKNGNKQVMQFNLELASNPEFTGSVAVAYARAAVRLNQRGETGAKTVTEISIDDIATEEQNSTFRYI